MKKVTILNTDEEKKAFAKKILESELKEPIKVTTEIYKPKRSLAINRLMWMWYGEIQLFLRDHFGQIHSTDDIHEYMVARLLPKKAVEINGNILNIRAHTSKMNNKEMCLYLETLDHYCGSELGLSLTHPADIYSEAMLDE